MLTFFRKFFQSKIGIVVTLAFLGLIALAFASMDVANTGTFGGVTGGDRVAAVGDKRITTADLSSNITSRVEQIRAQAPTITTQAFIEEGGAEEVLEQMISRWAIADFAQSIGLRAGNRLIDSEIVQLDAFRGLDGQFSQEAFRAALNQRGLTEATVREDLAMGLLARQLVTPASYAAQLPTSFAQRYAQLLGETRSGTVAPLPAVAFAPEGDPTEDQLQAYYTENRGRYIRPERRIVRYAVFDENSLGTLPAPTSEQIAARYQRDIENYSEIQQRSFTQLVLPTRAAAQALIDEVAGGVSLEAAALDKGLVTTPIATTDKSALASQTSAAVADAAFSAARGGLSAPAQGSLGWYVMRADTVGVRSGRSLQQASAEIVEQLRMEQRRLAFNEATENIDDSFADGASLSEIVSRYDLELQTTQPITATGQVYGSNESAPAELARVLSLAFEMDEGEPQLAETLAGQTLLVFDVSEITESAAAPLAEIRDDVVLAWRRDEGMAGAAAAAARVLDRLEGGASLANAISAEDVDLPVPGAIRLNRREMAQRQQMTPVTVLFFSMAEGTSKRVEQGGSSSWFVVQLDEIETPELAADDDIVGATRAQLSSTAGDEYIQQFVAAIENSLDIEVNDNAVQAVIAQLTGELQ